MGLKIVRTMVGGVGGVSEGELISGRQINKVSGVGQGCTVMDDVTPKWGFLSKLVPFSTAEPPPPP